MNKINYNNTLNKIIEEIKLQNNTPSLLLHSCCAPCSSSVLTKLASYFDITVFYYNPNITIEEEYIKRKQEEINFIAQINENANFVKKTQIKFLDADYNNKIFFEKVKGHEKEREGGNRCKICYELRLDATAQKAFDLKFNYFGTTLTVSPYKNSEILNEIGEKLQNKYDVKFLFSDFKKEDGYKKSIELSKEYNLYRQDYCGCVFSLKERLESKQNLKPTK